MRGELLGGDPYVVLELSFEACEARKNGSSPYIICSLEEDDSLVSSISMKDLEPPYPRPKTSASTAQRLIAQGMGQRVSSNFGIGELRKQEEARRNRIQMRQKMRDEAWGADDP
ncbi:hypothetical protein AMTR_s00030p00171760 [Amborella trichopoda]|uniref:Uncharacterized protein n=1 Tax=Amborella trichopoda TaxID=13333 RepID=U5CS93_AMBTC|nr:hypothetical protein AMTR_s00030p00171760 [Amborella trichopoda]